jgi:dTDP-4-amino-4,6-dideoxygalactose transaminase
MNKKFIKFGEPCLSKNELSSVNKIILSKWLGAGPVTKKFEKNFSKFKKVKYSLAVNSCTSALFLSLKLIGVGKGDEVITTPLTFCSTVNSIIHTGAKPVLVDIDKDTLNIDHTKITQKITKKTKAIIPVHFAGLPCRLDKIMEISKKYKIHIIEDCAHAIESKFKNKHVGTFGTTGCFSFYVNKNITTGDGGMLITNQKTINDTGEILRFNGMTKNAWKRYAQNFNTKSKQHYYDIKEAGYKSNMTDVQAGMGLEQLKKIHFFWKKRRKIFLEYRDRLKHLPIKFQDFNEKDIKHAYHLFVMQIEKKKNLKRNQLIEYLIKNKIGFGIHYTSINDLSYYKKKFKWNKATAPISFEVGRNIISLPIYPHLKNQEINFVIKKIKNFFQINE